MSMEVTGRTLFVMDCDGDEALVVKVARLALRLAGRHIATRLVVRAGRGRTGHR
jgi:hypothetical protein